MFASMRVERDGRAPLTVQDASTAALIAAANSTKPLV
jgi:hypothetical protein